MSHDFLAIQDIAMQVCLRALRHYRQDGRSIVVLLTLIGLSTGIGLMLPWPIAFVIDALSQNVVMHPILGQVLPTNEMAAIVAMGAAYFILRASQEILNYWRGKVALATDYRGLLRIRQQLFKKLQVLSLDFHRKQPIGDRLYRLTNDTLGFQMILGVSVSLAAAAVTLGVIAIIMLQHSLILTLIAFSSVPFLVSANIVFGRKLKHKSTFAKEQESRLTSSMQNALSRITLVQAYRREKDEYSAFSQVVNGAHQAGFATSRDFLLYKVAIGFVFAGCGAAILVYGSYLVRAKGGQQPLTPGDLTVFLSYLAMLYDPLCRITGAGADMQAGLAGVRRVFEVLDSTHYVPEASVPKSLPPLPRSLHFEKVSFAYQEGQPEVLKEISLTVTPGEMIGIVGASGVGKSSLLQLLPRFYDPCRGRILLGNTDIRDASLLDLRSHFAFVLQDSMLIPTTVAENIAYGRPGASREDIERAAEMAGAEFIYDLPFGFETVLTEGAANLSGGQRQRIAIARALITGAPFLVLDEPTSALDLATERRMLATLHQLKAARTLILVTHKLNTVTECDQILVFEQGRIVERGTHQSLIKAQGLYADLAGLHWQQNRITI